MLTSEPESRPPKYVFTKGLLAAIGFLLLTFLFVYSCWAEWGPYAWVAGVEVTLTGSYSVTHATFCWFLIYCLLAVLLFFPIKAAGRSILLLAYGVPASLIVAHIAATVYFMSTGGASLENLTLAETIQHAGFLPQNVTVGANVLSTLDFARATGEEAIKSRSNSGPASVDLYIPFDPSVWPDAETPVVLKSSKSGLSFIGTEKFTGTIRKSPLPYLIRRSWGDSNSGHVIVFEEGKSVRWIWGTPAVLYGIVLLCVMWNLVKAQFSSWRTSRKGG